MADLERWQAAGLGQGTGCNYRPWLSIRDVSSKGRKSRPGGFTTGRTHHLLSDNEHHFFLFADFAEHVVDIREQFPLFSLAETQQLALELGIRHPRYPGTTTPTVLTTDFVLTVKGPRGELLQRAYSVKSSSDLNGRKRKRILEKLQLERQYWVVRGIPWQLVTEREFNRTQITNLEWLSYLARLDVPGLEKSIPTFLTFVRGQWRDDVPLNVLLNAATTALGLASIDDADRLFRHCVWYHMIDVDLSMRITLRQPVKVLNVRTVHHFPKDFYDISLSA